MVRLIAAVVALALLLAGCGDDQTATVTERVTTVVETVERPADVEAPRRAGRSAPASGADDVGDGDRITVPDVVGEDHQLAQDTMQAAGLYVLDEQDATGQDRLLIIDRNWTVVRQDPPAGARVSPDRTITLYSKKDGE